MKNNFKKVKLGSIGRVTMCKRVMKHQTSSDGNIPFYKISTFGGKPDTYISKELYNEFCSKYSHPKKGDILVSAAGTVGKTVVYDGSPAYFQDSNIVWIANDESQILNSYLYYFYQTKPWLTTNGSTITRIYNENLRNIVVSFPENLEDQSRLTSILSYIDTKVSLNNKINLELEALAKTIYDYWFVQFDFPNENGKPYKSSRGKMAWSEELKGQIPEGWEVKKVFELIAKDKSGDWGKDEISENYTQEVFCIRGADINGLNGKEQCKPPKRFVSERNENKLLNPYDLIIEISGGSPSQSTGRIAHISQTTAKRFSSPLICSNFCKALTLKNYQFTYNFYFYWSRLYDNRVFFGYEGKTTGIKNLLFDNFINTNYMIVPTHQIIESFFYLMENIEEKKQKNLEENESLVQLRDWLLPMLMNGQIVLSNYKEPN